jgi:hypothetical protein
MPELNPVRRSGLFLCDSIRAIGLARLHPRRSTGHVTTFAYLQNLY